MRHKHPQAQIFDQLGDSSGIAQRIQIQDGPASPGLRLLQDGFETTRWRDLAGDGEVEVGSLSWLAVDPHLALHERDETFGDG